MSNDKDKEQFRDESHTSAKNKAQAEDPDIPLAALHSLIGHSMEGNVYKNTLDLSFERVVHNATPPDAHPESSIYKYGKNKKIEDLEDDESDEADEAGEGAHEPLPSVSAESMKAEAPEHEPLIFDDFSIEMFNSIQSSPSIEVHRELESQEYELESQETVIEGDLLEDEDTCPNAEEPWLIEEDDE